MTELNYAAPGSLDAAVGMLADAGSGARILAGGTDVLVLLHGDLIEPELIVDIKNIPELTEISSEGGAWRLGAATSGMKVMDHEGFAAAWPGVIEGVALIGSIQVKGRASVGGNLCNASPAADSVPPLIAAGAVANIIGPGGRRDLPVEDVITGPGQTALETGEMVVSFTFPKRPAAFRRLLSQADAEDRDGHRRGRRGGQSDARRCGRLHRRPGLARRGRAQTAAGRGGRGGADRNPGRRRGAGRSFEGGERGLRSDRRQARNDRVPDQDRRRDDTARGGNRARPGEEKLMAKAHVTTTINGDEYEFLCEPGQTLVDAIRNGLGLTGTKEGCSTGDCGACSVMLDGELVCSCLVLAVEADGKAVDTIEGMAEGEDDLHPLQRNFLELNGLQCGICTPGILIAARALLERNPDPTETEIRFWLAGNLCRCTGYDKVIRSVQAAAEEMREA